MQVACDHCGAEYELDESEITGRGVRITCPSCSHVFVVYQPKKEESFELEMDLELDENGEFSMDLDGMLESIIGDVEVGNVDADKADLDSVETNTVAGQSLTDQAPAPESNQNTFTSEAASENAFSSQGSMQGVSADSIETSIEHSDDAPTQTPITNDQIASLDVHSLNFASVGIKSWKVKKPIGLMFEYSDFKTFEKSLNDGRISSGDQISPDGKSWTPMSDIEDFKVFFCKTYLEFEQSEGVEEVKQVKEKVIPSLGGTNELASALAAAQAEVEQANRPQPSRKSDPKRTSRKPQSKRAPEPKKSSSGLLLNVGIGLAVMAGAWAVFGGDDTPAPVQTQQVQTVKPASEVANPDAEDQALKALREELQKNAAKLEEQNEPEPEPSSEEEPQLITKIPDEILAQQRALQGGQAPATPVKKTVNHAMEGQNALQAQQWSKAIESYNSAYQADPNPEYITSVGYAQFKSGQLSAAKKTLVNAVNKGSVLAHKWLGYVMKEEGDIPGSNSHFYKYLKSNPSDASLIQQEMMQ